MVREKKQVLNEVGVAFCNLEIDTSKRENYKDVDVVLRGTIQEVNILRLGEWAAGYIYHNPERYESNDGVFRYAFPCYGGVVLKIEFTGVNMSDYSYGLLQLEASSAMCELVRDYYIQRFCSSELYETIDTIITKMEQYVNTHLNLFVNNKYFICTPEFNFYMDSMKGMAV